MNLTAKLFIDPSQATDKATATIYSDVPLEQTPGKYERRLGGLSPAIDSVTLVVFPPHGGAPLLAIPMTSVLDPETSEPTGFWITDLTGLTLSSYSSLAFALVVSVGGVEHTVSEFAVLPANGAFCLNLL